MVFGNNGFDWIFILFYFTKNKPLIKKLINMYKIFWILKIFYNKMSLNEDFKILC